MRLNRYFVFGALMGIFVASSCCVFGIESSKAEPAKADSASAAYVVIETEGLNDDGNQRYAQMVATTLTPFKGRVVTQDATPLAIDESEAPKVAVSIIAFENLTDLKAWWNSAFQKALFEAREKVSKSRVFVVEGGKPF